jgi:hypothetical protein
MSGACSTDCRNAYKLLIGKPERTGHLEDRGVDGIILKRNLKNRGCGLEHMTQNRDQWRALVNTVMSVRTP